MPGEGANVIVIRETSGQHRRVELRGSGLPHQGTSWKTEQRVTTEWYPGNPQEATQQVFGPKESPATWAGTWHATLLLRTPCLYSSDNDTDTRIVNPATLIGLLDEIFYGGRKLRVTWTTEDFAGNAQTITREGRAKGWDWKYTRIEDVEWTIEWEWSGRGGKVAKTSTTRDAANASNFAQMSAASENFSRAAASAKIRAYKKTYKSSASYLTLGQLEKLAASPVAIVDNFNRTVQYNLNQLQRVVNLTQTVAVKTPLLVANSAVNIARGVLTSAQQFYNQITREPPEQKTLSNNVSDFTRSASYFGKTVDAQVELSRAAKAMELSNRASLASLTGARNAATAAQQRAATAPSTILAVHVVREGDTLISISQRYYQSPDYGDAIRKSNKLPFMPVTLPRGRPLIIPTKPATQRV